ncbi:hypothetical protein C900_00645 [Fulvivirga imtechensis AK7]|uniref:Uncharacterized protein n=2 Tax=Fulvivirga TaxID=396811 RepID=L8JHD9_9BACT|nr:hypothetical protein C900_00645 [Fulvivirga imtechensis AK7]
MHIEGEPVIAFCYIGRSGDENNVCFLTRENLFVRYKKRLTSFNNNSIKEITFEHKLLLFPMVTGGIMAPLSIHALLNSFMNPWLMLSTMIAGLFLMYIGWEGTSTMTVSTNVKDYYFFIKNITPNLISFADYANVFIADNEHGKKFYFLMKRSEWEQTKASGIFKQPQPLLLYNWSDMAGKSHPADQILLAIDPVEADINISFITHPNKDKLRPVISHNIPVEHIMEVKDQI